MLRSVTTDTSREQRESKRERESLYLGEDRDEDGEVPAVIGTAEESDYRECISEVVFTIYLGDILV